MGSRDIIQSLKIKRRQDRNKMMQIPEEADPSSMLALGAREMRSGDLNIAINCINKALELSPNDKTALLSRSKCYLLLGEPQKALEDAESVLTEKVKDPNNPKAIYYKAEALYHLGDFELSLVYYHRGIKIRPEFDQFRLGIQKAKEAIQNILGNNGGSMKTAPLINIQKIKNLDDLKTHEQSDHQVKPKLEQSENVDDQKSAIITDKKNQSSLMKQKNNTLNFLGQLNVDKKYLQNLLKRSDIKAAHQVSADHITKYAKEGILFLNNRQEFWRQQRSSTASSSNPI
ncbi:outer dynein arm-docking complex subunit 4 isoform X1 [Aphidius gifuensis]|nr:outer dynein arm-docking complex subunit 4 isoform X1 [Aphidius gifuensis]